VVDDIVAVGAAGAGTEEGRDAHVADAERVEVIEQGGGLREGEPAVELQAIGRGGQPRAVLREFAQCVFEERLGLDLGSVTEDDVEAHAIGRRRGVAIVCHG
jgi:hypothetical protein